MSLGRLLFVASAIALVAAAASLSAYVGRASSRGDEVSIIPSSSVVNVCPAEVSRPTVILKAKGVPAACPASHYKWDVSGGSIDGTGAEVVWNFTGINVDYSKERGEPTSKNFYHATLTVEGGEGCGDRRTVLFPTRVVAWDCAPSVVNQPDRPTPGTDLSKRTSDAQCPNISLCCHAVGAGQNMPLSATLIGAPAGVIPIYKWTVYGGEVVSGQGSASIMVDYSDYEDQPLVATLEVSGYGPRCSASCAPKREMSICVPHYESVPQVRRRFVPYPPPPPYHGPRRRHYTGVVRRRPRGHWVYWTERTSKLVACPPSPSPVKRKS
jgi:hypothetical protein